MSEYTGKFIDGDGLALINQLIDEKLKNLVGGDSYGTYAMGETIIGTATDGRPLYRYVSEVIPSDLSGSAPAYVVLQFPENTIDAIYRSDVITRVTSGTSGYSSNMYMGDTSFQLYVTFYRGYGQDNFTLHTTKPTVVHRCIFEYTKKNDPPDA